MESLWPKNFDCDCKGISFPEKILNEQANILGSVTENKVTAHLLFGYFDPYIKIYKQFYDPQNYDCASTFRLYYEKNNFSDVFSISHDSRIYPLKIHIYNRFLKDEIKSEVNGMNIKEYGQDDIMSVDYFVVDNKEMFIDFIKLIFNSKFLRFYIYYLMEEEFPLETEAFNKRIDNNVSK